MLFSVSAILTLACVVVPFVLAHEHKTSKKRPEPHPWRVHRLWVPFLAAPFLAAMTVFAARYELTPAPISSTAPSSTVHVICSPWVEAAIAPQSRSQGLLQPQGLSLSRCHDEDLGVTCWARQGAGGISCLRDKP